MFQLSYLATDKKRLLERLREKLTNAKTHRERTETSLQIQELEVQAKPYEKCDLIEADELRNQLLHKINILSGLGKAASVEVFRMHLKDVEFHIQTLQLDEMLREQEKLKRSEGPNQHEHSITQNSLKKEIARKRAFGRERWLIGFDDEPSDKK